jgi:hypothetical protein
LSICSLLQYTCLGHANYIAIEYCHFASHPSLAYMQTEVLPANPQITTNSHQPKEIESTDLYKTTHHCKPNTNKIDFHTNKATN